jgi:hypothetical protein
VKSIEIAAFSVENVAKSIEIAANSVENAAKSIKKMAKLYATLAFTGVLQSPSAPVLLI